MLPSFCNDTVIRIRPGTKESRGSTIFDWENATELQIEGCSVQPASTSLSEDGRVLNIRDERTMFAPAGSDIRDGDRIRFDGEIFTINGDVRIQSTAFGLEHLHITLKRYSG